MMCYQAKVIRKRMGELRSIITDTAVKYDSGILDEASALSIINKCGDEIDMLFRGASRLNDLRSEVRREERNRH